VRVGIVLLETARLVATLDGTELDGRPAVATPKWLNCKPVMEE
jgi:hypothetical protein